jgi:hypothetical protein
MVDLLWHQWSSVGVAGYAGAGQNSIIDPEALVLATSRYGRYDSRLMDEAMDWLMKYGRRISLQRLQGLNKSWPNVSEPRVFAAMAEVLGQQVAHRKWRVMTDGSTEHPDPEPFFLTADGSDAPHFGEMDPIFLKHGYKRGKLAFRSMSQAPDPRVKENLLFTLRGLLGVNARAEIIAWLLSHDSGHPAAIARSTGYFSKSIQQILNEMEESGHVVSVRIGREKHFRLRKSDWHFMLPASSDGENYFPRWVDWMPLFSAINWFVETLDQPGLEEKIDHFQAIQLREALDRATPALVQAGRMDQMRANRDLRGSDLIKELLSDLESLVP